MASCTSSAPHTAPYPANSVVGGAVELCGLEFAWDRNHPILAIERLSIARGERVFLTGPSGSGKSTLLGVLAGVMVPARGKVRVLGVELGSLGRAARDRFRGDHIGFIFQMFNLVPYLSVVENIVLPLHFSPKRAGRVAGPQRSEVMRLLDALGLSAALVNRRVSDLSVGQQQRVAAARALVGNPELILADEPTSALDADNRENFLSLLTQECAKRGTTLLFVSHDAALAPLFDRSIALTSVNAIQ